MFRSVTKRPKSTNTRKQQAVEERETYELTGTGQKGDYTIFVEGESESQTACAHAQDCRELWRSRSVD